jgi:xanthine dehydrogenase YagS FAD-binding subunit
MCVALAALDALVCVSGPRGERRIPFHQFHLAPGDHPERETTLAAGELITAVEIPAVPFAVRSTYLKVRDRASYAFALASAAVALDIQDGAIREARIALGGVGTVPWRAREAERVLAGRRPDAESYRAAADAALAGAAGHAHNRFKIELARRTLIRALTRTGALA